MILLDTHIWIWWNNADARLSSRHLYILNGMGASASGVCVMSCWEVAMLAERNRLLLNVDVADWVEAALSRPQTKLVELTPQIAIESVRLPGAIHRDPVDRLLVATARLSDCPIMTVDAEILAYPHVKTLA
jgi:PIN domain nuclease of toxin-antitoxin system